MDLRTRGSSGLPPKRVAACGTEPVRPFGEWASSTPPGSSGAEAPSDPVTAGVRSVSRSAGGNRSGSPRCPHPTSIRSPGSRSRSRRTMCCHLRSRTSSPNHLSVSRARSRSMPEPHLEGPSPRLRDRLVDLDGLVLVGRLQARKGNRRPTFYPQLTHRLVHRPTCGNAVRPQPCAPNLWTTRVQQRAIAGSRDHQQAAM